MGNSTSGGRAVHLHPSLWRTARVLAHVERLRILRHLFQQSAGKTVSEIAAALQFRLPLASVYLRALNARGLLAAARHGRWVYYRPLADPTVPEAAALLLALKRGLLPGPKSLDRAVRDLTGFTHPRRSVIIQTLGKETRSMEWLAGKTGISRPALTRHLEKLLRRGFVSRRRGGFRCRAPASLLGRLLLDLARQKT